MTKQQLKERLLESGVKNMHEFGYPDATKENILTDEVYKMFFTSMLTESSGRNKYVDEAIGELLSQIIGSKSEK